MTSLRARIQATGAFLSGMILPNIAAFLAWGFLTALFAPGGWWPNAGLGVLISPMLLTLLPILIGFTGGRLVHGIRGGVIGALATTGAIVGSDVPMFLAAMALGPLGGWLMREVDRILVRRTPAAINMLVSNFSAGILGGVLAVTALTTVGPVVRATTTWLATGADHLMRSGLIPLVAIVIEPAKVLFLNNAINHGVLAPLGAAQTHAAGRSIFFLLETNPGPGLGLLLAYWLRGAPVARQSAPGAILVQFFGGIHEIYFPYVLMKPSTFVAVICGGLAANLTFLATGAGLVATPSPGSVFAELAMAPRGGAWPVALGIAVGAVGACLAALPIVQAADTPLAAADLATAQARVAALKAESRGSQLTAEPAIVFACDAGMGSSVLGAAILTERLRAADLDVGVGHAAIAELPPSADIVVVHESLADRVRATVPDATVYPVHEFLNSAAYDGLLDLLRARLARRAETHA